MTNTDTSVLRVLYALRIIDVSKIIRSSRCLLSKQERFKVDKQHSAFDKIQRAKWTKAWSLIKHISDTKYCRSVETRPSRKAEDLGSQIDVYAHQQQTKSLHVFFHTKKNQYPASRCTSPSAMCFHIKLFFTYTQQKLHFAQSQHTKAIYLRVYSMINRQPYTFKIPGSDK